MLAKGVHGPARLVAVITLSVLWSVTKKAPFE
jgi:hypothetical protein